MVKNLRDQLVQDILSLPDAPLIIHQVNERLEEERRKREIFYNEISEFEKAEFINGEIIIHSPVKKEHNDVSGLLSRLISTHVDNYKLGYVGIEKIMISLSRNDYEPDICLFRKEKSDTFTKGQSLFPIPDLVVEILSKRTAKNDRGVKFDDYEAHKVTEYWIIDPEKEILEQYRMSEVGKYELMLKSGEGTIISESIDGFQISIRSIFDEEENLKELKRLLA